jgi:hypothetical protein
MLTGFEFNMTHKYNHSVQLCAGQTLVAHTCAFGGVDTKIRLLDSAGEQVVLNDGGNVTEVLDDDGCLANGQPVTVIGSAFEDYASYAYVNGPSYLKYINTGLETTLFYILAYCPICHDAFNCSPEQYGTYIGVKPCQDVSVTYTITGQQCPSPPPPSPPPPPPSPPPSPSPPPPPPPSPPPPSPSPPPRPVSLPGSAIPSVHRFDAAAVTVLPNSSGISVADSGTTILPGGSRASLHLSGAASVRNYRFALDGAPSANEQAINGLVITNRSAPLAGGITVRLTALYRIHASSVPLLPGFSDNHYRHLFNIGGFAAVRQPRACARVGRGLRRTNKRDH